MSLLGRLGALAALTLTVFVAAGCGGTVLDLSKTEDQIRADFEHTQHAKVSSVDCPSGIEVKAGKTFKCTITLVGGKQETETLEILNSDADLKVTDLKANK